MIATIIAHWERAVAKTSKSSSKTSKDNAAAAKQDIRVTTYAGPGAKPVMHTVPWPKVPPKGALIKIGACGVCGTDQHILKGHWPKPLPWPFTLGHELAGVIVEIGDELKTDHMGKKIGVGSKLMLPPLMPCGFCEWCKRYPEQSNKCLTPVYYGRYLGFDKPPHLWGGWAEYVYVDLGELPGTKIYKLPDDMSLLLGSLSEPLTSCIRGFNRAIRAGAFKWGDTVVIQGTGPIGILAVAAAQEMGAGRVIAVGAPENPRLQLAREFGAEATVDIEKHKTAEDRIKAVRHTGVTFERPPGFSLSDAWSEVVDRVDQLRTPIHAQATIAPEWLSILRMNCLHPPFKFSSVAVAYVSEHPKNTRICSEILCFGSLHRRANKEGFALSSSRR